MVRHIVMWTLEERAEGASKTENAARIKSMLEGLYERIPEIRQIEVGVSIFAAVPECDVVLSSTFEDRAALEAYQQHPLHRECVAFIGGITAERRVVDYEI